MLQTVTSIDLEVAGVPYFDFCYLRKLIDGMMTDCIDNDHL